MYLDKDFLTIFIGKILQVVIMVAIIKVSTMLLSPAEMGNIYIFLTIQTFFVFTFISPIGQYINRKTHIWDNDNKIIDNLFLFTLYTFIISFMSIVVGFVLYDIFGISNDISFSGFLILLFGFTLFLTMNKTIIPMLNMLHYRISFTVLTIFTSVGILVFGYLFIKIFEAGSVAWLSSILLSNIIFLFVGYIVLIKKAKNRFSGIVSNFQNISIFKIKYILKIVLPISLATLFMWTQNSGYRIIIEQNIGLEFLGFLGVGLAVSGQIASTIESIVSQYLTPIYYKKITVQNFDERIDSFNELLNITLPIYFLLALYVSFLSPYIINILVDEKYSSVYIFTIYGIWLEFFRMTSNLFYTVSLSELNTKKIILPYILGSFITLFGIYLASKNMNYEFFMPIVLVLGGIVTMILMYFSMIKVLPFKINFKMMLISLLISTPYSLLYYYANWINSIYLSSYIIILLTGLYFLGTIYFIYRKGLNSANN